MKTTSFPLAGFIKYISKRIVTSFIVYYLAVLAVWWLCNFIPGVPANYTSSAPNLEVWYLLRIWIPRTLEVAIIPIIILNIAAAKYGKFTAANKGKKSDNLLQVLTITSISIPVWLIAIVLQFNVAVTIPNLTNDLIKLPFYGLYDTLQYWRPEYQFPFVTGFRMIDTLLDNRIELFFDTLRHLIVPSIAYFIGFFGHLTRPARAYMLDVMEEDYIRTARAKGCSRKRVINNHAFRNAIIGYSTIIGFNITELIIGAVYIEIVFDFDGIGAVMIYAIREKDYFMIRGTTIVICLVVFVVNLFNDIIYAVLDPRIMYD